jgi:cobalt/nickel transport system permease protein
LRAFDRSDRIYMAMVSRGYDGEARSLPLPKIRTSHWVILISILGILGVLLAFAILFWG